MGSAKGWSTSVWDLIGIYLDPMGVYDRSISGSVMDCARGSCDVARKGSSKRGNLMAYISNDGIVQMEIL